MEPSEKLLARYHQEAPAYCEYWAPVLLTASHCYLDTFLPPVDALTILDVGTGPGTLVPALRTKWPQACVVGVDVAEGMLTLASERAPVAMMSAMNLGMRPGSVDLAFMAFMLFHVPEPLLGLREVRSALAPGGRVAVITWAGEPDGAAERIWKEVLDAHGAVPKELLPRLSRHKLTDTPEKVGKLLSDAGFVEIRCEAAFVDHAVPRTDYLQLKTRVGSSRERLETLGDAAADCVRAVVARLDMLEDDGFAMTLPLVFATACAAGTP